IRHTGHAAVAADVGGNAFERHDRDRSRFLGDPGLLRVHHVHDDAALEHLRQTSLETQTSGFHWIASSLDTSTRSPVHEPDNYCSAESTPIRTTTDAALKAHSHPATRTAAA